MLEPSGQVGNEAAHLQSTKEIVMNVTHFKDCWRWDYLNMKGFVELVPIEWLVYYMLPNPGYKTTTIHGDEVNKDELKQSILDVGLQHPAVIEVSKQTQKARVVSGNNRIAISRDLNQAYFPCYVMIVDNFESDGYGEGYYVDDVLDADLLERTSQNTVVAPSDIFVSLKDRTFKKK